MKRRAIFALALFALAGPARAASLQEQTVEGWDRYVQRTETRIARELGDGDRFLALDFLPREEALAAERRLRRGEIVTEKLATLDERGEPIEVPKGLVHHWRGTVFVPGVELGALVAWLQDYDHHSRYFDDVEDSRLVGRQGGAFDIFLRLRREKVVTVHYDTEHRVVYTRHGSGRVSSASIATHIAELEAAGTPEESERPPGDDRGFLWRLNSYWRFQQTPSGVVVECESLSLSRGVPGAVRWLIGAYLDSVPRESLEATLGPIRSEGLRTLASGGAAVAPVADSGR